MAETISNTASEVSADGRTVLLALHSQNEVLKSGLYDHARRAGWNVVDLRYYNMELPEAVQADGVIFHLAPEEAMVRQFLRMHVPVVQIEDYLLHQKCSCVISDRRAVGRIAAEHFASRGFRSMAYLHSEEYEHSMGELIGGSFVERARSLGARADLIAVQHPGQVIPWKREGALAKRFGEAISKLHLPLGIFTFHDIMAVRICGYCQAIGLRVPERVAVLGAGNDPYKCDFAATPLSSVDPNYFSLGRTAAELLDGLMNGEPTPAKPIVIAPTGVVTRKSTDVLALPDVETARALRYMWEHLAEPLGVPDIAEAVGLSRRKLERHFRAHLGRGVNEELNRKRIEWCCELLVATKTTVKAIAEQTGFTSGKHFFKVFRETTGMSPRKYRLVQAARLREAESSETHGQP